MTTPINLNRYRKAKDRAEKKARADENAVKFGRTKAEKQRDDLENRRAATKLDQKKRDDEA